MHTLGETRVTTPTAIETQLPWKRNEDEAEGLQQNEFPAWASNKEYLAYNSPSATFLGKFYLIWNVANLKYIPYMFHKKKYIASNPNVFKINMEQNLIQKKVLYHNLNLFRFKLE